MAPALPWLRRCLVSIGVNGYHTLGDEQKAPKDSETLKAWRGWEMGKGYPPPSQLWGMGRRKLPQRGPGPGRN